MAEAPVWKEPLTCSPPQALHHGLATLSVCLQKVQFWNSWKSSVLLSSTLGPVLPPGGRRETTEPPWYHGMLHLSTQQMCLSFSYLILQPTPSLCVGSHPLATLNGSCLQHQMINSHLD